MKYILILTSFLMRCLTIVYLRRPAPSASVSSLYYGFFYLKDKRFSVYFGSSVSKMYYLTKFGVSKRLNLHPLLFIIFINEIVKNLTSKYQIYADDLQIYSYITSYADHLVLQGYIYLIVDRSNFNCLPLYIEKTKYIIHTSKTAVSNFIYRINYANNHRIKDQWWGYRFELLVVFSWFHQPHD